MGYSRTVRRDKLERILQQDPFLTDKQLADHFEVSVATIRLDRMALQIPELRVRTRYLASKTYSKVRSMQSQEIIGELIDLQLEEYGISILSVTDDMVFQRTGILRGHHLFAQGNSLAVAVINTEKALTASSKIRFFQPVKQLERVIAKATVVDKQKSRYIIDVKSRVEEELVFRGEFVIVDTIGKEEPKDENSS